MNRTFDTQGSDTKDVIFDNLAFTVYGNCRELSSSPFRDHANRDFGSPCIIFSRVMWVFGIKLGQSCKHI